MKKLINSINRAPLRCGFFTVAIALAWLALSPPLKAQCPTFCDGAVGGNTALGNNALDSVNSGLGGINNTAVGFNALTADTTGQYNTAVGSGALRSNTSGDFNMAIGTEALRDSTAASFNLAIGFRVGFHNTTGRHLTGIGAAAMRNNTTGEFNTAIGADALRENTTSSDNVAVGDSALAVYNGLNAGIDGFNTAVGSIALTALTEGFQNTAVGRRAMESATSGNNNTSVGWRSGDNLLTGDNNTFLGRQAGVNYNADESNNIVIGGGNFGVSGDSGAIRIGSNLSSGGINIVNNGAAANAITIGDDLASNGIIILETLLGSTISIGSALNAPNAQTFVGGIYNSVPALVPHPVVVSANGKLADATLSSRRFKKDIAPIDKISEGILALKPVTFHFKNDDTNCPQFGLIAEDVAEVNPDWITRDPQGEIYGVRYDTIPVLLLNEFLKEHKKVEEQQASIAELKSTVAQQQKGMEVLTAQLKEQAAQIQKVSAQLEASKPAPKVVTNK
jgi:trimeric autotransporter adhesin